MRAVSRLRRGPGTPPGLSTAVGIMRDVEARYACVAAWCVLLDYVSVNVHAADAAELMRLLAAMGMPGDCSRMLIEAHEPELETAPANATAIVSEALRLSRYCCSIGPAY